MSDFHPLRRRARGQGARLVIGVVLGVLLVAFFRVQIVRSSQWELRSESNRLRPLAIPAPRGTIFDRNGRVIADNVPAYAVSLLPSPIDSMAATLERIRSHVRMSDLRVERLLERARRDRNRPLLVTSDASFEEVSALQERLADFPELIIEMRPKRRYAAGRAVAHAMGYVGEITGEELDEPEFRDYEQGMIVGRGGVEEQYEARLQGEQGVRVVEVDARGRIVGSFAGELATPAVPGQDLRLNLDLELMEWIHRIFPAGMRGAVVALDAEDGGVLALYSAPSFDPNDFVGGIDPELWNALRTDSARPLFNRTVQGLYPPASPWKLATAAFGIDLGVVTPEETMPVPCTGGMQFGNRYFRCWDPDGHGFQDMEGALGTSCDVYFYQLGMRIGLDRFLDEGNRLGFGDACGIDLPLENEGIFPEGRGFWERRFGYRPNDSEVLSLSIGQGPNSQTPLKMAQFYLAVARGGSAPAPRIASDGLPAGEAWTVDLSARAFQAMLDGLRAVTAEGGTAHLSSLEHWDFVGKTGTAQNAQDPDVPHAWFGALAGPRGRPPEIVVMALVEFGESGSRVAAPLAAKTADFWLRRRYGVPVDTIQTLGEHLRAGVPARWGWGEAAERHRRTPSPGVDAPLPPDAGRDVEGVGGSEAAVPATELPTSGRGERR